VIAALLARGWTSQPAGDSCGINSLASAAVLVRLPLWATAIAPPAALVLNSGWAFSQRQPPREEWRVWPIARCPWEDGQHRLVDHLAEQPHLPGDEHAAIVGDGYAGRVLAVLGAR
jgi:hypothetical protein